VIATGARRRGATGCEIAATATIRSRSCPMDATAPMDAMDGLIRSKGLGGSRRPTTAPTVAWTTWPMEAVAITASCSAAKLPTAPTGPAATERAALIERSGPVDDNYEKASFERGLLEGRNHNRMGNSSCRRWGVLIDVAQTGRIEGGEHAHGGIGSQAEAQVSMDVG